MPHGMADAAAPSAKLVLHRIFPILEQVTLYRRAWLPIDLLAGLSVAAVALPTAIAYPAIAGLPPQVGLYAAILAPIGYFFFGPSRQLMVGPDTATTVVLATVLGTLAVAAPEQRIVLAASLALAVGACYVLAGLIGFGAIANFLSRPVLMGFLSGVAIDLLIGQLDRLTAVEVKSSGLVKPLLEFVRNLDQLNPVTLALGLGLFALLRIMRQYAPRLPGPLVVIAAGILIAYVFNLGAHHVDLVGAVPASLPHFSLPQPTDIHPHEFALGTLAILLVSFGSGIVTARSFGAKNHYAVDANRELIGFGAANIASGLFSGFPVTSSDSRTAVNDAMGGRSQLVGLTAAAGLLIIALFLGDLLAYLPQAALGAVLASAAIDLIDLKGFRLLWRLSRMELVIAVIALLGVLTLGVLSGVAIAIGVTLAHLLWLASKPRDALLGRMPGRDTLCKLHHHPEAKPIPGLAIYLPQSALVFFNVDYIVQRLLDSARDLPDKESWVILDASAISHIDTTAALALKEAQAVLTRRGIALAVAEVHAEPRAMIERVGLAERIGPDMFFPSAEAAADAFAERRDSRQPGTETN